MNVNCEDCGEIYDDAERFTRCPHELIMPRAALERKKNALKLLGKDVSFVSDPDGPTFWVQQVRNDGMVTIEGMSGAFAPHLFVVRKPPLPDDDPDEKSLWPDCLPGVEPKSELLERLRDIRRYVDDDDRPKPYRRAQIVEALDAGIAAMTRESRRESLRAVIQDMLANEGSRTGRPEKAMHELHARAIALLLEDELNRCEALRTAYQGLTMEAQNEVIDAFTKVVLDEYNALLENQI